MPGPKMGPRPPDFDEDLVRQAPTFVRWQKLPPGQKLRYACRDFVKGQGDDEERLMRRIMIARRNNLRDHAILKRARSKTDPTGTGTRTGEDSHGHGQSHSPSMAMEMETLHSIAPVKVVKVKVIKDETVTPPPLKKKRGNAYVMTDEEVMREMDIPAVEATRSFKSWLDLEDGEEFTYNQKYIKGREGHGWLLKKNIWRRMRYRRENKKMVEKMKGDPAVADAALALTLTLTDATSNDDALALGGMLNEYEASIVSSIPEEPGVDVDVDVDMNMNMNINIAKNSFKSSVEVVAASAARHIVDHALPSNLLADAADVNGNINGIPEHSGGSDHDNLHDAVVEAAVAAAESYVKQARENETSDMNNMGNHHHLVTHHQHVHATMDGNSHHSGIAVDASGLSVHNPIMTLPPTTSISGDGMDVDVDEHHHHHTPNPLIGFEDAMDIAAKLAAAASAAETMSSASGNFHDDDDDDDGGADGEQTEDLGEDRNEDDVDVDIGDNKGYVDDDDDDDDDDENWMDMNSEPVISQVLQVQKSEVEMVSPVLTQEAPFVEVTKVADIPQCNEINNNTSPNHDGVEVSHLKEKEDQAVLSAKEEKDNIDEMSMWTNLDNNEEVYTETKAVPVKKVSPPVIPQGNPFIEVQEVTDVSQFRESSESLSLKRDVGSPGPDIQVNTIIQGSVVTPPEWEEQNVSFSFGLLTDGNSSPSHGTYSALTGTGMPLLDNIASKLQSSALNAIQNEIYSGDLLGGERPLLISVTEDVSFVAPFDRLFMVRCIVKINLPLSLRINGSCDLWRIEAAILNTLRGNLPDMSGM